MTDATEVRFGRLGQWLTAGIVAVGLAAAGFTGSAVAWADDGSASRASTVNDLNDRGQMKSLRLQMAMHHRGRLTSTLSNVLKKASETAQTITQNIK